MNHWLRLKAFTERNRDLVFEVIRVYLGLGLFAKGVSFAGHWSADWFLARRQALLSAAPLHKLNGTA